jgi:hypothetical protein
MGEMQFSVCELARRIAVIIRRDLDRHDGNLSARRGDVRAWRQAPA